MDFIGERLAADPTLHVYHYAPYEPTALKRLMGRYGTREDEVDRLLRGAVLVDLLRAVRQSLRASVESYSIKKMEQFYGFVREIDLRDAGSSIVAFEQWLELGEGERPSSDHLDRIEAYNRDDVVSNQRLQDWLEELRHELEDLTGQPVPRPAPRVDSVPADLTEAQARVQALVERLAGPDVVPVDPAERTPEEHARWLLGQLLGWHRREDKSMWWDFHHLMDLTPEQLVDEDDPIGMLEPVGPLDEPKNGKQTWRYAFPPQDFDLGRGEVYDPAQKQERPNDSPFELAGRRGRSRRRRRRDGRPPAPARQGPSARHRAAQLGPDGDHQASLIEIGEWVAEQWHRRPTVRISAARDLLRGLPPRVGQAPGEDLGRPGETRPRGCPPAGPDARSDDPPDPGTAGVRQDVQRRPDDPDAARGRQARRHHRDEPQGHRQPAQGGAQGGRRRSPTSASGSSRRARRSRSLTTSE